MVAIMAPALAVDPAVIALEARSISISGRTYTLQIPKGFELELLTDRLERPRMLTFHHNGDLFIGSRAGKIYRLEPPYRKPEVLISLPGYPHSVAFRQGEMLIARSDGLYRAPYRSGQRRIDPASVTLLAALPAGPGHNSRTVATGPDGHIYLSLGIRGNCSDEYLDAPYPFDKRRGGVLVLDESNDTPRWRSFASGLRNPVGFDWQPQTGVMYASNNGPDHWGYELPPEYFCRLEPGSFHGMPWFQFDGKTLRRDNCIASKPPRPVQEVTTPAVTFPARNAPMGVAFIATDSLAPAFNGDAVVALHGSWGTKPNGGPVGDPASRRPPKLVLVRFHNGNALRVDDLVTGFQLADGRRLARPIGVAVGPDGAIYFTSDSGTQALFRLRRQQSR